MAAGGMVGANERCSEWVPTRHGLKEQAVCVLGGAQSAPTAAVLGDVFWDVLSIEQRIVKRKGHTWKVERRT